MSGVKETLISKEETEKILTQINSNTITGLRNKAIVSLLAVTGIQLKELINLEWESLNFKKEELKLKDRTLGLDGRTASLLKHWRKRQLKKIGKASLVFTTTTKSHKTGKKGHKGKTAPGKSLQARYIRRMVKKYGKKSGIDNKISPQAFRRTFGYNVYKETRDLEEVKEKLGLKNIENAELYKDLYKKCGDNIKKYNQVEKIIDVLLEMY